MRLVWSRRGEQYDDIEGRMTSTHTASLPLLHSNRRWLLVQPDTETFQLVGDNFQIVERFQYIQNDKDQVARSGNGNDLATTTFTVLGSLNNTWELVARW